MKKYKLPKEGFERVRRQFSKWTLGLLSFMYGIGFTMLMIYTGSDFKTLLFMIPILGIGTYFGWRRSIKTQEEAWNSYELTINEKELIQTQDNRKAVIIDKSEITEIIKNNGFLVLKTADVYRALSIPREIENYEGIEKLLAEISPIRQQTKLENRFLILKIGGFVLGISLLLYSFIISQDLITSLLTGSVIIGGLIWSIVVIQKGNVDKRLKQQSFMVVLVILPILVKLYFQLF